MPKPEACHIVACRLSRTTDLQISPKVPPKDLNAQMSVAANATTTRATIWIFYTYRLPPCQLCPSQPGHFRISLSLSISLSYKSQHFTQPQPFGLPCYMHTSYSQKDRWHLTATNCYSIACCAYYPDTLHSIQHDIQMSCLCSQKAFHRAHHVFKPFANRTSILQLRLHDTIVRCTKARCYSIEVLPLKTVPPKDKRQIAFLRYCQES